MIKIAFIGFRHPHIFDLYNRCVERDDIEITAACEEDNSCLQELANTNIKITHTCYKEMLSTINCDAIAVGDYYSIRGERIIQALQAGKHVISDKPACTSPEELEIIKNLVKNKKIGCMLDLRDSPVFIGLRDLISGDEIGEVNAVQIGGQHPLLLSKRPHWYFEKGKHGGTLNDIGIHAIDILPWITGLEIKQIVSARCWNARLPQFPYFKECGQGMLEMSNDAGIVCDFSYLVPDSFEYSVPQYWRTTIWGDKGILEAGINQEYISIYKNGEKKPKNKPLSAGNPGGYLDSFIRDIYEKTNQDDLKTADVLKATHTSLLLQSSADKNMSYVKV